ETGEKTLYRVWFCKSRLCPMCNWRRAMKHGIQSQKVVAEVIKQKPTVRWLFLTLTVRNVYDGTELNKSLSDMSKGFIIMMIFQMIIIDECNIIKLIITYLVLVLTICKITVSGSISLPFRGAFHLSLTVLVHYRSLESI